MHAPLPPYRPVNPTRQPGSTHHSATWALVLVYVGLVVYASLYPFAPWASNGLSPWQFWTHPLPHYWTRFDLVANLLGYLPLGFFITLATLREPAQGMHKWAVFLGIALPTVLSACIETLQNYLPNRVPSNVDFLLNSAGALSGALLAWVSSKLGLLQAWEATRQRWFAPNAHHTGLVLLMLWPFALLHPLPVPFGLGQIQEKLENQLAQWLANTPFIDWLPLHDIEPQPLLDWQITLSIALGLLAPCLLAFDLVPAWRKRIFLGALVMVLGAFATALGHTLGINPQHAFSWVWKPVQLGFAAAALALCICMFLPRFVCRLLAIASLCAQLFIINNAAVSAYFDWDVQSTWLPAQYIRFYESVTWLGWLWPYAALLHLCVALVRTSRTTRSIRQP